MLGISMEELRDRLSWGHDAEFTYQGDEYVIQQDGATPNMVIWQITPEAKCISEHAAPEKGQIPDECIDAVLNDKCFNGKSFMEIEKDVTVDSIL